MTDALKNVALEVSYDGRAFQGWQRNKGRATVQGALEEGVRTVFEVDAQVQGAGRTDRGAHALGQVVTVRLPNTLTAAEIQEKLNGELAEGVAIERAADAPDDFHARHSAVAKTYRYVIWNDEELPLEYEHRVWHVKGKLDVGAMKRAMPRLLGTHDFTTFATNSNYERKSSERTLHRSELYFESPTIEMTFTADGFLYKMVRNLVRAVVKVGEGRSTPPMLARILDAKDRQAAPGSAPASGLYLDEVYYDPSPFGETPG